MHRHQLAGEVHLQYFMPRQDAADRPDSSASCTSPAASSPAVAMWEYHQAHAALQQPPAPSWSSYAGTSTAALLDGSAFAADSVAAADMRLPIGEHVHGHAWSHGELSNSTGYKENFLDLLASKNVTPEMFEDVPGSRYAAPAGSDLSPMKYEVAGSPLFLGSGSNAALEAPGMNMMSCMPCYAADGHHQVKEGSNHHQQQEHANPMASFLQQISTRTSAGMHASLDYSGLGALNKICQESRDTESSPFGMRSLPDFGSFGDYRSTKEPMSVQPYARCADRSDSARQEQEIVSARSSSSGAASDRKKRPSEERRESTVKKSKQEASTASPPKQQVPKVKLGEKITALQQIVSPFGKTDTASVLFETIKYVKFLHEQVQLLSEPYTNASRNKGCNNVPWGDHAAETSRGEGEPHGLRGRGLCLVPVSWTPEVYRDGTAMDYWTPAYRGCLYR
ncbi:transcription factor bHLH68 [Brachypodium distachyon]|uniref:BHLH domain-containing protein n=1 Tax=Brachypodium distachyon TaxID=15368 RepID=A0A0Q3QG04_BRADI|nr:transcription factor bHLH68 [Brachypodium distachyon]KQK00682.1 hypothetical protein BRADI_3g51100v3 [Brachypodium distachyon]|eukprot:XP_003572796.1 transcription factor bHLH68 [Brachypodium distachyon]